MIGAAAGACLLSETERPIMTVALAPFPTVILCRSATALRKYRPPLPASIDTRS